MTGLGSRFKNLGMDGKPARLGIMGGTFDPIHVGHLRIAEEVREALDLDGVLFIPAGNPVFKKGRAITDGNRRLNQVKQAVASNPHFDVCDLEVQRDGDTYTVDTLSALRKYFSSNVEFYFIVGDDAAESLGKWKDCKRLAELAHFAIAVGRPGSIEQECLQETLLKAADFKLHFVPVSSLEISSSNIRDRLAEGRSIRYLVPEDVRIQEVEWEKEELSAHGEEKGANLFKNPKDAIDPFSEEFFKARKKELKDRVSKKRFDHSINVAKTSAALAKQYGVDEDKARLAGLLHDWDKGYDDEGIRQRVIELGMEDELDPAVVESMPRVLHGNTAARALKRDYPEIPSDVIQAINRHTTAAEGMEPLDMILYIADAIEPSRQFGRIDELRASVGKVDLEELFFRTYEYWTFLLLEKRAPLHPETIHIWNFYTSQLKAREGKQK